MAYFPNGTAGMMFIARNCEFCAQWKEREGYPGNGEGCPVWDAHVLYYTHKTPTADLCELLIGDTGDEPRCNMYTPISAAKEAERNGQLRLPGESE